MSTSDPTLCPLHRVFVLSGSTSCTLWTLAGSQGTDKEDRPTPYPALWLFDRLNYSNLNIEVDPFASGTGQACMNWSSIVLVPQIASTGCPAYIPRRLTIQHFRPTFLSDDLIAPPEQRVSSHTITAYQDVVLLISLPNLCGTQHHRIPSP